MYMKTKQQYRVYHDRRQELVQRVWAAHPDKDGVIFLCGGFEHDRVRFRQDSSFYYYTGLIEPGLCLVIDRSGRTTLFMPAYSTQREQWVVSAVTPTDECAKTLMIDKISVLGKPVRGYRFSPLSGAEEYAELIAFLSDLDIQKKHIFCLNSSSLTEMVDQKVLLERLLQMASCGREAVCDISSIVGQMRRKKSKREIELLYNAIKVTMSAQETVARLIEEGKNEADIQAALEYVFTESHARVAFPSIVAGGKNATVLHYDENKADLKKGDLVVVDIGAEYEYYCADITRTYPVSRAFTQRQKELYTIVLEAQELVASHAKPGVWLNNKEKPEQSLHHIAYNFFEERGYGKYFVHGIGHFLGLDVHDVGDYREPLAEGDVITIEPGLYIPEEGIGIRIEDDYWIIKDGSMCLSEDLPRISDDVEHLMVKPAEDEESEHQESEEH